MNPNVWESGASATPPSPPTTPSTGYPTAGDPTLGVPPTKGGEYWFYQLAAELTAILTAAGITADHTNLTQLLTALRSAGVFQTPALGDRTTKAATMACFSQEFGSSLGASGYQKLPSGLIIQWGTVASNSVAPYTTTVTLPIAFPTLCAALSVLIGGNTSGDTVVRSASSLNLGTSAIQFTANPVTTNSCIWIAIGF